MIRTGTCSWTEKTLIQSGEFYPKDTRTAEERLRYYADHFDTVEVDSTYYAVPTIQNSSLWADRTPDGFVFHVKAYGALTGHGVDPKTLPEVISDQLPDRDRDQKYVYIKERSLLENIAERFRDAMTHWSEPTNSGWLYFSFHRGFITATEAWILS